MHAWREREGRVGQQAGMHAWREREGRVGQHAGMHAWREREGRVGQQAGMHALTPCLPLPACRTLEKQDRERDERTKAFNAMITARANRAGIQMVKDNKDRLEREARLAAQAEAQKEREYAAAVGPLGRYNFTCNSPAQLQRTINALPA